MIKASNRVDGFLGLGRGQRRSVLLPEPTTPTGAAADWPILPVICAFAACFLLMSWPWVFGFVTIPWDAKAHFQPQIQFLADSLARGDWPWWNPYVFAGQPQVADPQSMIFSPPFLALALLSRNPSLWAADMTVLAAMALGGVGMIVYFRDRGWHWAGALLAAIVFSFGAAMAWRIQHTGQVLSLAYLPWGLVALERAMDRRSYLYGVLLGVVAACIVLGRDQVALLCVYLLAGRIIWLWASADRPGKAIRATLPPLVAGGALAVAIIAIPVLMTVLLAADSNRPTIDFEGAGRGSLHPGLLLTLALPQLFGPAGHMADYWGPPSFAWNDTGLFIAQNVGILYVGAAPLLLILVGLATGQLWRAEIRFFTVALVVMLLYALGWYTPVFRAMYTLLPGVNLYRRPADAVFLIGALSAVLAGYTVHRWFEKPWRTVSWVALALCAAAVTVAALGAVILGFRLDRFDRLGGPLLGGLLAFATAALALYWCRDRIALMPWRAALGLALVTSADLAWNNGPTTSSALPPSCYDVLEPRSQDPVITFLKQNVVQDSTRRDRIELAGLGFHWPNASMTHRLENTLGYNPVRLGLYSRATGAEDHIGLPEQRKFSKLMPSYRSPLANMLGLRYIAAGAPIESFDKALRSGDFVLRLQTPEGQYIYENPRALPRLLFAADAQAADFEAILATGNWPPFEPAKTVLLAKPPLAATPRAPGTAVLASYSNTHIVIDAVSPDGGYVVLNDVWHPWWSATVDGQPVEILRANVLFRAIALPHGRHRVEFRFRPLQGMRDALARRSPP